MKTLTAALTLALVVLIGCDSGKEAKLQEDQRNFQAALKSQVDYEQWKLDDATAVGIFDQRQYLTFRKCHEEPPSIAANQKVCAALRSRVAKVEAKNEAQTRREKAAW